MIVMLSGKHQDEEPAHDVLAAEKFPVGDADPRLHLEEPHDVLAAEEFPLGTADPVLHHHGPVAVPGDPSGIEEPHDVLAADEFPVPAHGPSGAGVTLTHETRDASRLHRVLALAGGVLALVLLRRRRR
jgi:hypothetical protein